MERVYIADWLYNAGIVGFLRALGGHDIENGKLLDASGREIKGVEIGDNYFEFDREAVEGFTGKFLRAAAEKHYQFYIKPYFESISTSVSSDLDKAKELRKRLQNFVKKLEFKVEIPEITKKNFDEDVERLKSFIKKLKEYLGELPSEEVLTFSTSWISKDLMNLSNKLRTKEYKELTPGEKIQKLIDTQVKRLILKPSKKLIIPCIICEGRSAIKDLTFSTSLSAFAGFNEDNINFIYLYTRNRQLPICEICNAILFSASLGFVPIGNYYDNRFLFVNNSASVEELFKDNLRLESILRKERENPLIEFFTEKVILAHERTSPLTLSGISVIELEAQKPRVKNFNVSYEKARLFTQEKLTENLRKLGKASFKLKEGKASKTVSLLEEIVNQLLTDSISFTFIYKLFRYYLKDRNNKNKPSSDVEVYFNPFQIFQILNTYFQYLKLFGGGSMKTLEERELRQAWRKGKELRSFFEDARQENKIDSIAFKLLNALRTSNYPRFMDILLRVYAGFSKEVPYFLVKGAQNPEIFQLLGYSFVAGFLGEEKNSSEREEE